MIDGGMIPGQYKRRKNNRMATKTIELTSAEISVNGLDGANAHIRNDGAGTVLISKKAGITAGSDGVMSVPAGQAVTIYGISGNIYLKGAGSVQIVTDDYTEIPFKTSAQSGSGADEVARAAVNAHSANTTVHVTAAEKAAWSAKADKSDIPASLPADGGNADTLDGKHAEEFMQPVTITGVSLGFTAGQEVSVTEFVNALADKFGNEAPVFAVVKWFDAEMCSIICDDGSTVAFNGGFIVGKVSHLTAWSSSRLVYFPANVTENGYNGYVIQTQATSVDFASATISRINDGGNAASVGTYTAEKLAALETRIANLESGAGT